MLDFAFSLPTRIVFGAAAQPLLERELDAQRATRVLLVSGQASARRNGSLDAITALLDARGLARRAHAGCPQNPDDDFVHAGALAALDHGADLIVAVGGGSVIDASKAIALLAANGETDIWAYATDRARFVAPALPLGVVLTTTGTGAEVNGGFVLTRAATQEKVAFSCLSARPRFAWCNPDFARTLPPDVLSDNYADIVSHLLEQYFSLEDTPGIVDAMILEAIRYLIEQTEDLARWHDSYHVRANTMFASTISLSYLFSCGKKVPWSLHYLVHALAARRPVSHGAALRTVMPGWLVWLAGTPAHAERARRLAATLGVDDGCALGAFFVEHFGRMGCTPQPLPSADEKQAIVDALAADVAFMARAGLSGADVRGMLDWAHDCANDRANG